MIELPTGQCREHRREDLITRIARVAFDPAADCPVFRGFFERVIDVLEVPGEAQEGWTVRRMELREFVQRAAGYSLTASNREEVLFLLVGVGANGKTKFLEIIRHVLGDYARATPFFHVPGEPRRSHPE